MAEIMDLIPLNDLACDADGWVSIGEDPYFLLRPGSGHLPTGWTLVSFAAQSRDIQLSPVLYVDEGTGFSEAGVRFLSVPHVTGAGQLVRLPDRVHALRLDPLSGPGRFQLGDVRFQPVSSLRAAVIRASRLARNPRLASRYIAAAMQIARRPGRGVLQQALRDSPAPDVCGSYDDWVRIYDTLHAQDRVAIAKRIASMRSRPTISVIVPLYNTPEWVLRRCIESVRGQLWEEWELCLADDASTAPHVAAVCEKYARRDRRIRFIRRTENGHISAASNTALSLATGEFVALLDHDDELAPHALYMVAEALELRPDLDMIFSDEDKIDEAGKRCEPWFKPDWNHDLMLAQNAVVHLAVYRRKLVEQVGGFRIGYEGSQDYDLTLRVVEATTPERIRHLPYVLYHWRAMSGSVALDVDEKDYPYTAAARAIQDHLDRTGRVGARIERQTHPGYYRVHWPLPPEPPRVAVIIPTRDKLKLLRVAVEGLLHKTEYAAIDLIVVDNNSEEEETLRYLEDIRSNHGVRVLHYQHPYSFAALNNWAIAQTDALLVCLLNNDVEVITPGWLAEMVSIALRPEVGAVGCKLSYPNDTIQHAGIVVGIGGRAGHPHVGHLRTDPGYFGRAACTQRLSAVTAACLVMRREVFDQIGGFNERDFAIAFNDVDLGLRLNKAGYAVVWTPHAELYHHESASLGPSSDERRRKQFEVECANLRRLWPEAIANDPYYNPNLTISGGDWGLAFPPRVEKPWRQLKPKHRKIASS